EDSLWISDITYRAFIHFDLSKKPLDIIKAEIVLNFFYVSGSTTITIYKAKSDDWQESTITWNNAPSYNTIVCTGTIYGNARFSIELPDTSYEWNQVTLVVKSSDDQGFDTITSKDNTYSTSLDDVPHIMYTYTPPGIPSYNPFIIIGIISICTLFLIKGVSKKFVSVGKI
ncbi:MAG: DNRLRE domain-containing protein, partial [Promethearchaeota archaeon]